MLEYMSESKRNIQDEDVSYQEESSSNSESQGDSRYENSNNLPYDRRQIYHQFKIPPERYQKDYQVWDCVDFLKDQFDEIEDYGYDFSYTNKYNWKQKENPQNQIEKHRSIRRKVKLRFMCWRCPNKRWTSIVGTMEMKFKFLFSDQLEHRNFPYILKFRLRIYRMKCADCDKFGVPSIYESQLKTFARSACITIADILEQVPAPKYKDKRYKMKEEVHNHQVELCEACQLGKCFAKPKLT